MCVSMYVLVPVCIDIYACTLFVNVPMYAAVCAFPCIWRMWGCTVTNGTITFLSLKGKQNCIFHELLKETLVKTSAIGQVRSVFSCVLLV